MRYASMKSATSAKRNFITNLSTRSPPLIFNPEYDTIGLMKERLAAAATVGMMLTGCGAANADINRNGCVDVTDLVAAQRTDVNADGLLSRADIDFVRAYYGHGCHTADSSKTHEQTNIEALSYTDYSLYAMNGPYAYNMGLWVAKLNNPRTTSIQREIDRAHDITGHFTLQPGERLNFIESFGQRHFGEDEGYLPAHGASGKLISGSGMCPLAHALYREALAHGMHMTLAKMLHPPMPGFTTPDEKGISIYTTDEDNQNLEFYNPYAYPVTFHFRFTSAKQHDPGTLSIAVEHSQA